MKKIVIALVIASAFLCGFVYLCGPSPAGGTPQPMCETETDTPVPTEEITDIPSVPTIDLDTPTVQVETPIPPPRRSPGPKLTRTAVKVRTLPAPNEDTVDQVSPVTGASLRPKFSAVEFCWSAVLVLVLVVLLRGKRH